MAVGGGVEFAPKPLLGMKRQRRCRTAGCCLSVDSSFFRLSTYAYVADLISPRNTRFRHLTFAMQSAYVKTGSLAVTFSYQPLSSASQKTIPTLQTAPRLLRLPRAGSEKIALRHAIVGPPARSSDFYITTTV